MERYYESIPEAERRAFPRGLFEQLHEEMQLYPTPEDFRQNVIGLGRLYGETALLKGFQRCAMLAAQAEHAHQIPTRSRMYSFDDNFYSGAVFAMHCKVRQRSPELRRQLYRYDPLEAYMMDGMDEEVELARKEIDEFHTSTWESYFERMGEPEKELILDASIRMCEGKDDNVARENSFLVGFMFAAVSIDRLIAYLTP